MTDLTTEERFFIAEELLGWHRSSHPEKKGTWWRDPSENPPDAWKCEDSDFMPDLMKSEQWQLQAVLEAVEEAGIGPEFLQELYSEIGLSVSGHPEISSQQMKFLSAPPEQICRAILYVLEEED